MFFVPCDYVGKYLFLFSNDFFFVCTFDEYIIKLQVRQKKTYQF
jgi:hypothetical protein